MGCCLALFFEWDDRMDEWLKRIEVKKVLLGVKRVILSNTEGLPPITWAQYETCLSPVIVTNTYLLTQQACYSFCLNIMNWYICFV
jgi:hypothetical protein